MVKVIILTQFRARVGGREFTFYPSQKVKLDDSVAGKLVLEGKGRLIEGDGKAVCYGMIDETLRRINRDYKGGALNWIKRNRPVIWKRLIELESEINLFALQGDQVELNRVLGEYERLVIDAVHSWCSKSEPLFEAKS
jgi:hypothetical protein